MGEPVAIKETVDSKVEKLKKDKNSPRTPTRKKPGMPKGHITKKKLEQLAIKRAFDQRILTVVDRLFNAQLSLALGIQSLMVKVKEVDAQGRTLRYRHEAVTDEEVIKQYLDWEQGIGDNTSPDDDTHYYYLTTAAPDNRAIDSLLNRGLGKAPDRLEVTGGFFSKSELTIKVIDSEKDIIDIGEDGQIKTDNRQPGEPEQEGQGNSGADVESAPELSP